MAAEKRTLRDYWESIHNDFPEDTPEHIKLSLEAMFYTGVWSYESLLHAVSKSADPEAFLIRLRALGKEIHAAFDDLEVRKKKCKEEMERKGETKH